MDFIELTDKLEIRRAVRSLRGDYRNDRAGWAALAETELSHFRGARVHLLSHAEELLSINVSNFGKRKKNAWEPYLNWYIAFTRKEYRQQGYATELARLVYGAARESGCLRVKSLAGTLGGLRLHNRLGDQLWAVTSCNEVQIDSPLVPTEQFPNEVPPNARKWDNLGRPLTLEEVLSRLEGRLRYDGQDTRPWG